MSMYSADTITSAAPRTDSALIAKLVQMQWHPGLPIFASESFLAAVGDQYGWLGGFDVEGRQRCLLPYTEIRKPGLRMVRFRVATIPVGGELELAEERSFLDSAMAFFRSAGCDLVIPSTNTALFRTYPVGAVAAPYGTLIKNLEHDEKRLMSEIHETFRYNIRRAGRDGVSVRSGPEHVRLAHALTAETLKRSGVPFKKYDEFERMIVALGEYVKIFIVEHKGAPQGCMVAPFSLDGAYTWYCGSLAEPTVGAMHLLHWHAMLHFRALGVKRFDFTGVRIDPEKGSKQDGIFNFKRRFGGALVQGYMWKYAFKPLKGMVYSAAIRMLRGGDVVDQEHHKLSR